MFGSLKEKLKKWIEKTKEKDESPKEEAKKTKKEKKEATAKTKKKTKTKKIKTPKKNNKTVTEIVAPPTESAEEIIKEDESAEEVIEDSVEFEDAEDLVEEKGTSEKAKEIVEEVDAAQQVEEIAEEAHEKKSFFSRFQRKYTEENFVSDFEELEMILLQNNVAYDAIEFLREDLNKKLVGKNFKDIDLAEEIKDSIKSLLIDPPNFIDTIKDSLKEKKPYIILLAGINGSGKTTTIAKLANLLQKNKLSVCLAAADTFRAASIEQLQEHADRLKISLLKKDYGSDPAAVGFDAVNYAKKNNIDVVLIDTAGRMQNRDSLMREMEKIVRVNKPDMKIFIGESITGNDAIEQAKAFNETMDLSGIILSKADVDEKGGTAISVSFVTKKPIYFLGVGQEYKDLEEFSKEKLIDRLGL